MYYKINMVTEEDGWIVIDTDDRDAEPVKALCASIAEELGKEMFQLYEGDAQFMIKGDPYKLVFQYDHMFGTVVILDNLADKDAVTLLLERHFEKLKDKKI